MYKFGVYAHRGRINPLNIEHPRPLPLNLSNNLKHKTKYKIIDKIVQCTRALYCPRHAQVQDKQRRVHFIYFNIFLRRPLAWAFISYCMRARR